MSQLPVAAAAAQQELTGLAGIVEDVLVALGAPGAALLVAAENIVPPIPSEVILPLSGFLAGRGELSVVALIVATTIGSLVGAQVFYELARALGERRLRMILTRLRFVSDRDLDRALRVFGRYGTAMVFFGRFVPIVRSVVSFPAGTTRMSRVRFLAYTGLGSGLWNTAWILAGHQLGSHWHNAAQISDVFSTVVVIALALLLLRFAWHRIGQLRARAVEGRSEETGSYTRK